MSAHTADYGTAGSIKNAEAHLRSGRFLIISGDVLTDFDLSAAIAFHCEKNADATIVLTRTSNPLQYGIVIADTGRPHPPVSRKTKLGRSLQRYHQHRNLHPRTARFRLDPTSSRVRF